MSKKLTFRRAASRQQSRSERSSVSPSAPLSSKPSWAEGFKKSNTFFLVEIIVIVAAIGGLWLSYLEASRNSIVAEETLKEIQEARLERVVQIYNTATHPQTPPEARKKALRFLRDQGESLAGIDLSCKAIGTSEVIQDDSQSILPNCIRAPDLSGVVLNDANLFDANLHAANLMEANLTDADLQEAILIDVNLDFADLSGANLSRAALDGASLLEAGLENAVLFKADLSGAQFVSVSARQADLSGTRLSRAALLYAHLRGADLSGSQIVGTTFHGADLNDANFSGSDLREADLSSTGLKKADLSKTKLQEANFSKSNLSHADLNGAHLSGAIFLEATVVGANFENAWAWHDFKPIDLPQTVEIVVCVFFSEIHDRDVRPDPCIAPFTE